MSAKARPGPSYEPFSGDGLDMPDADKMVVARWIEAYAKRVGTSSKWTLGLDDVPEGEPLKAAKDAHARNLMLALLAHARHWEQQWQKIRAACGAEEEEIDALRSTQAGATVEARKWAANRGIEALLQRRVPLTVEDVPKLLEWMTTDDPDDEYLMPVEAIVAAVQRVFRDAPASPQVQALLMSAAAWLRSSEYKPTKLQATKLERLVENTAEEADVASAADARPLFSSLTWTPAFAGTPGVLLPLKATLGMIPDFTPPPRQAIGDDRHLLAHDSPLSEEHWLLSKLISEIAGEERHSVDAHLGTRTGNLIQAMPEKEIGRLLLASAERQVELDERTINVNNPLDGRPKCVAWNLGITIHELNHDLDRNATFDVLLLLGAISRWRNMVAPPYIEGLIGKVEGYAASKPLDDGERFILQRLAITLVDGPPKGWPPPILTRVATLLDASAIIYLVPGERWTDALNEHIATRKAPQRQSWRKLLTHALTATGARPSAKWGKQAQSLVKAIGGKDVAKALEQSFHLATQGRSVPLPLPYRFWFPDVQMHNDNATCLRGLVWLTPLLDASNFTRLLGSLAVSCYRKVPGIGPRAPRVGNACIYALSEIKSEQAVGQLAMLKVRVKFGTAQKEIDKAFNAAALALGLPREDIEEMAVPTYGLEQVGIRQETMGDCTAEIRVDGADATLHWSRADKPLKAVPAQVKKDFKDDLKELQQAHKDIAAMLPAQRERIDSLFLAQKSWPHDTWRQRYLDHPLVGTIARRLIWSFTRGEQRGHAIFLDGRLVTCEDQPLDWIDADTRVELWHPLNEGAGTIAAWRDWFDRHQIRQPFKQAHREVYLLTDAERNTRTYSNRFAAHIIRQHQFNALCAARGWKNKLRLMVDEDYPPTTRLLPEWNLRAEFWVEGISDPNGADINDSGVFLRLATDQVRFYPTEARQLSAHARGGGYRTWGNQPVDEPLPLDQVPPLVLSEIMRDVDLFVGVASVGNDPTWQDGGRQARFADYWRSYSFGDLGAAAVTRKAVLEKVIPRLKIAPLCSFQDNFLVVRGSLRTYKIHMGSSNILMEPNDQYLCIVPARGVAAKSDAAGVFLPFEGDERLSIIISKALMLADDARITDSSIVNQIKIRG